MIFFSHNCYIFELDMTPAADAVGKSDSKRILFWDNVGVGLDLF